MKVTPLIHVCFFFIFLGLMGYLSWSITYQDCETNVPMVSHCEEYNTDNYQCVRQGYTEENWLGFTNWDNEYWNCEELGTVIRSCTQYGQSSPSNLTSDYRWCK